MCQLQGKSHDRSESLDSSLGRLGSLAKIPCLPLCRSQLWRAEQPWPAGEYLLATHNAFVIAVAVSCLALAGEVLLGRLIRDREEVVK